MLIAQLISDVAANSRRLHGAVHEHVIPIQVTPISVDLNPTFSVLFRRRIFCWVVDPREGAHSCLADTMQGGATLKFHLNDSRSGR